MKTIRAEEDDGGNDRVSAASRVQSITPHVAHSSVDSVNMPKVHMLKSFNTNAKRKRGADVATEAGGWPKHQHKVWRNRILTYTRSATTMAAKQRREFRHRLHLLALRLRITVRISRRLACTFISASGVHLARR